MQITLTVDPTDKVAVSRLCEYLLSSVGFINPLKTTKLPQEHALPIFPPVPTVAEQAFAAPEVPAVNVFGDVQPAVTDLRDFATAMVNEPLTVNIPTPPAPPGIQTDAKGMPWDGRIHATTRALVADGTWRYKRGSDEALIAQVEGELRAMMGVPVPPVVEAPPVVIEAPAAPFVDNAAVPAPPASIIPPPPVVTAPSAGAVPTAFPSSAPSYVTLMKAITSAVHVAKTHTQADITSACARLNIPSLMALASRPDLVPAMATEMGLAL